MSHPLVDQLRFARYEFQRGLKGLSEEGAQHRFVPMNCISWNVGHLAWQEQRYWLIRGQGITLIPEVNKLYANGDPACIPTLAEALDVWKKITRAADPWLDELTLEKLEEGVLIKSPTPVLFGTLLQRTTYHYWYHNGENLAIRQMLGHANLPQFVGDIDRHAPYRRAEAD